MKEFTFGSLFAGIGGIDLGLERAGMICKWQVENNKYATKILEKHWPNVRRYGDIREVDDLNWVDLVCGGFPCQDISLAGKGDGIEGSRSGLWSEFARIIRLVRPKYVLVENVTSLRSREMHRVLGDLATCGYDAEWDCIPAVAFNATHRRDRIFIVAYTNEPRLQRGSNTRKKYENDAYVFPGSGFGKLSEIDNPVEKWGDRPLLGRGVHGVPNRVDRIKCLGNAVVPQVAEYIGKLMLDYEKRIYF